MNHAILSTAALYFPAVSEHTRSAASHKADSAASDIRVPASGMCVRVGFRSNQNLPVSPRAASEQACHVTGGVGRFGSWVIPRQWEVTSRAVCAGRPGVGLVAAFRGQAAESNTLIRDQKGVAVVYRAARALQCQHIDATAGSIGFAQASGLGGGPWGARRENKRGVVGMGRGTSLSSSRRVGSVGLAVIHIYTPCCDENPPPSERVGCADQA